VFRQIRLIAIDMDGTLLNSQGIITQRTGDILRKAKDEGIIVSICTGRFLENVSMMLHDAGLDVPIISLNGCVIEVNGDRIRESHLLPEAGKAIYEALESVHASYYIFSPKMVITRRAEIMHHSEAKYAERLTAKYGVSFVTGSNAALEAISKPMYKFYVYQDSRSCSLEAAWEAVKTIGGAEFTRSSSRNFEIMPSGIDKGYGISQLAAWLGMPMDQVMAIGDHDNDLPMIRAAGFGVAMGNASPKIKQEADAITLDNDHDGVAEAIMRLVFSPQRAANDT